MLAYAAHRPIVAKRGSSPNAMLAIIAAHVALIALVMSAKMELPPTFHPTRTIVDLIHEDDPLPPNPIEQPVRPAPRPTTLTVPRAKPKGTTAYTGARIITMKGDEVIEHGTIVVKDDRIVAVGPTASMSLPAEAKHVDVSGKTIIPGLFDEHAHLHYSTLDILPQRPWKYLANLAYGVTTTHDPSAIAFAIDPSLFRVQRVPVYVETEGRCAGQVVADPRRQWSPLPEIDVCTSVDSARLLARFHARLGLQPDPRPA